MDDNQNSRGNQSKEVTSTPIPEEVSPSVTSPNDVGGGFPSNFPTDEPRVYEEKGSKLSFVLGALVFFVVVFGAIYWFFLKDRLGFFNPTVSKPPATNEQIVLKYWGLWDEKAVFDPLISEYASKNPNIKIQYEKMSPAQYRERLIARSKTGNGPDIYRFHNTWIPELEDVLVPIPTEILTNSQFEQIFYPIHVKDLKIGDKFYGIPLMVDGLVLIYNDTMLKQAGILTPPSVWIGDQNDVITVANKLTVRDSSGGIVTSGIAIGTANNIDHFGEIYATLLLLNGGDLKKLDTKEASEALQLYRKFAEDNVWNESMSNSIPAFISGKVAMIFGPSWQVTNIKAQNPELNVKVAKIPKGLDNSAVSIANYWVEGVDKYSKHQLEAWKFLKFLSQKDSLTKLFEEQSKLQIFGSAYSRRDMADLLKSNQYLGPVIEQATNDIYISAPIVQRTYDSGINDEILKYVENAVNQTSQGVDYTTALSTAAQGVRQVLEKYKIQ